jgi:periodic tryptophan protein 2
LEEEYDSDSEMYSYPKVLKDDVSERRTPPDIRTKSLHFSPTGQCWAAATIEGLVIYSVDQELMFHPFDLSHDVTPDTIRKALKDGEFSQALAMSLMLNEAILIEEIVEAIPLASVTMVADQLPLKQVDVFLEFIAKQLGLSRHLEFYLCWCSVLLSKYAHSLKQHSSSISSLFQALQRNLSRHLNDLGPVANENSYLLKFLVSVEH